MDNYFDEAYGMNYANDFKEYWESFMQKSQEEREDELEAWEKAIGITHKHLHIPRIIDVEAVNVQ